jgi:thiol-disulfide isomerase/thioredoxin
MNIIQKIIIVLLIGIIGCKGKKINQPNSEKQAEWKIDKVILTSLEGERMNLDQYKGKTVFINFWATWCKPCLEEMPTIEKAQTILKDKNIQFLFASDEAIQQIEKFKSHNNYKFNFVRVENPEELNIISLPTTFIFNPDGKLVFSEIGYRNWDDKTNIDLILKIAK